MKFFLTLLTLLVAQGGALACEHGFFPKTNDIFRPTHSDRVIKNNSYSKILVMQLQKIYTPYFNHQDKSKKLIVHFDWDNFAVNAYATKDLNNNPVIHITGGLLSHDLLTQDGLALILCHELGHFLGGAPKKLRGRSNKKSWSSAEGQADYFATAHCLKKIFRETFVSEIQPKVEQSVHASRLENELNRICETKTCKRIALASYNVAEVYAAIELYSKELSLISKDTFNVYQTIYTHPNPQCRLDTMIAALRCPNSEHINFSKKSENSSACDNINFRRPGCWYSPSLPF